MGHNVVLARDSAYSNQLAEKFLSFKDDNRFTDCRIVIGGETGDQRDTMECHANILCAFSPVIDRMLENPMIEGKTKVLAFPEIDPKIMRLILDYMYTGSITITESHVKEIIRACDFLQMFEPRDRYIKEVLKTVSSGNVIGWMRLASVLSLDSVMSLCLDVISDSFQEVISSEEFLGLNLEELEYFLQDCCASLDISGDGKLGAVFSWLAVAPEIRVCERTQNIVGSYIHDCSKSMLSRIHVKYQALLAANTSLQMDVDGALQRKDKSTLQAAISAILSLVVIGGDFNRIGWNLGQDDVTEFTTIPYDVFGSCQSVCKYEGVGLVVSGGLQKRVCALYDALTKTWKSLEVLSMPRHSHVSVCILDELFVIGGKVMDAWEHMIWTPTMESLTLDVQGAKWQKAPAIPSMLQFPKVADCAESIYVMGDHCPSLFHFDIFSRTWTEKPALSNNPGAGFSLASGNGKLFAVGEHVTSVFCVATDCWSSINQPGMVHNYGAAVFWDGDFMLLGGDNADVEKYNAEEDRWEMASFKLTKPLRHHFALSMIDNGSS